MNYDLDDISLLVTCSAATPWWPLEQRLNKSAYTLGFDLIGQDDATIEELLSRNPPNLLEGRYGSLLHACVSLTVMGRDGKRYRTKTVPRTAAGPDFRTLLLKLGKSFGVIEEITLRIHPVPELIDWHYSYWPTRADGEAYIAELRARHVTPSFGGTYDMDQLPKALQREAQALVSLRYEGLSGMVQCYMKQASRLAKRTGGKLVRSSKRRTVPLLEQLMRESVS